MKAPQSVRFILAFYLLILTSLVTSVVWTLLFGPYAIIFSVVSGFAIGWYGMTFACQSPYWDVLDKYPENH